MTNRTVPVQTQQTRSLETRIKSAYRKLLSKEGNYTILIGTPGTYALVCRPVAVSSQPGHLIQTDSQVYPTP